MEFLALRHRQLIAAVVELVVGVALDPVEVNSVGLAQRQKPLPEVGVQCGLFVRLHPALGLPAFGPALVQSVDDVFGVGVEFYDARLLQGFQGGDDPGELHAVVGGLRLAPGELPFKFPVLKNGPPASRPRVSRTGPIGIDGNCFHGRPPYLNDPVILVHHTVESIGGGVKGGGVVGPCHGGLRQLSHGAIEGGGL